MASSVLEEGMHLWHNVLNSLQKDDRITSLMIARTLFIRHLSKANRSFFPFGQKCSKQFSSLLIPQKLLRTPSASPLNIFNTLPVHPWGCLLDFLQSVDFSPVLGCPKLTIAHQMCQGWEIIPSLTPWPPGDLWANTAQSVAVLPHHNYEFGFNSLHHDPQPLLKAKLLPSQSVPSLDYCLE